MLIGLPARLDGRQMLRQGSFQVAIGAGTPGVARQVFRPEAKTEGPEKIFEHIKHDFNARSDTVKFEGGGGREREIGGHQHDRPPGSDRPEEPEPVTERLPE